MNVAVFGAGVVGGYFGGRLAEAGEAVTFIARGAHLEAMKRGGLTVHSLAGDVTLEPVRAADNPAEVGPVDVVLLGVKVWGVPEAAEAMRPLMGPHTVVLPLQNGVEAPGQLVSVLGRDHVLGGLCRIVAFVDGPGRIRHAGADPFVEFGELDNRKSERVARLLAAFQGAKGVTASVPNDIHAAMWRKFLLIVSWSSVGAVTRSPAGAFRSVPETRALLEAVMRETFAVAKARGVDLAEEVIDQTLAFIDALPAGGTASMQRDLTDGKPSELEAQTGAVVRMGRETGVATPVSTLIYHSLLPLEMRARGRLSF